MTEPGGLQTGSQPGNQLLATRVDTTTWYSGVGIAETIDMTVDGVRSGSWIDIGLGGAGTAAEAAVWVIDPFGALVAAGFGFAVEHVRPLSDALDWITGDPDQVDANAQTWRNVSVELADTGDLYIRAVRQQLPDWAGPAHDAYRAQAGETGDMLAALGRAADGVAVIVAMTGSLVALVRTLVRDAIGELVSVLIARIPLWTLESVGSFGLATPYVEAQVSALVVKWAARIARLLRGLVVSLRNLTPALTTLDEALTTIDRLLRRRRMGAGGKWPTIDERQGGVVAQIDDMSCVSAVGEMLSGRPQRELIEELGSPSSAPPLARALGPPWRYRNCDDDEIEMLNQSAPWGAELYDGNGRLGHMVLVDGFDAGGRLMIRDPADGGTTYKMDLDDFRRYWNGNAVYQE
ncbi:hypothetical protein [Allorhizocola rhizosphaerae]|uniref:hypothetical protein n=1 Tax=Allorhizocola rhizosphaerae TaxID=1872709 RepID=UPI000E3E0FB2|nr:hypothetical protein [Allorhizocola rhizosphaerae]